MNPAIKKEFRKIQECYRILFETYLDQVVKVETTSEIFTEMLDGMEPFYTERRAPAEIVRDFIAGMTDDYFLNVITSYSIHYTKLYDFFIPYFYCLYRKFYSLSSTNQLFQRLF